MTLATQLRREVGAYFLSPVAYLVLCFFLAVMGFSFWFMINLLATGAHDAELHRELFASFFFWMVNLIVVPAITMRSFAEEKREGTLEALMTAPVTDTQVVLAKFFGAWIFYLLLWLPTISYLFIIRYYSAGTTTLDPGSLVASYFGAMLVGGLFIAIGLLCSSLTANQLVAAVMSFALLSIIFFMGFIPYFSVGSGSLHLFARYFSCADHMVEFSRGTVDTRPVVFYLSSMVLVLFATVRSVEARQWR